MTNDVLSTLSAIRPEATPLDEPWSRTTLATIVAAPTHRPAPRTRRFRAVLAGAMGVGLLGAGAATAAGLTPGSFTDAFRDWGVLSRTNDPGGRAVDPAMAKRVDTAAGPDGTVFSLVAAPGRDGFSCVAVLFETSACAAEPDPNEFLDANGSQCAETPPADARFGDMPALDVQRQPGVLGERDVRVFSISSGAATRAVVRSTDGRVHPVLSYEGRFYGWYVGHGDDTPAAVVTGYAADGTRVGRTRL